MTHLVFGAMAPSLGEQLSSQGVLFQLPQCRQWQKDADALTRLSVRGLLSESQTTKLRQKLVNQIFKELRSPK